MQGPWGRSKPWGREEITPGWAPGEAQPQAGKPGLREEVGGFPRRTEKPRGGQRTSGAGEFAAGAAPARVARPRSQARRPGTQRSLTLWTYPIRAPSWYDAPLSFSFVWMSWQRRTRAAAELRAKGWLRVPGSASAVARRRRASGAKGEPRPLARGGSRARARRAHYPTPGGSLGLACLRGTTRAPPAWVCQQNWGATLVCLVRSGLLGLALPLETEDPDIFPELSAIWKRIFARSVSTGLLSLSKFLQ